MDVTAHHDPFIAPGLDRLVQRQEGQHTGRQGAQGREKQLLLFCIRKQLPSYGIHYSREGEKGKNREYTMKTIA